MPRKRETDLRRYDLSNGSRGKYVVKAIRSLETSMVDKKVAAVLAGPRLALLAASTWLVCYHASMRRGRTKTTSFSLDEATLQNLKALAARRHNGNVSALLAEVAMREAKFAAAEIYFEKYGVAPLTAAAIERVEAEWQGALVPKKKRRRTA